MVGISDFEMRRVEIESNPVTYAHYIRSAPITETANTGRLSIALPALTDYSLLGTVRFIEREGGFA